MDATCKLLVIVWLLMPPDVSPIGSSCNLINIQANHVKVKMGSPLSRIRFKLKCPIIEA